MYPGWSDGANRGCPTLHRYYGHQESLHAIQGLVSPYTRSYQSRGSISRKGLHSNCRFDDSHVAHCRSFEHFSSCIFKLLYRTIWISHCVSGLPPTSQFIFLFHQRHHFCKELDSNPVEFCGGRKDLFGEA